jgi:23S rRNA (pseudouridine1915-N3)-methyltransferase
LKLQVFYIGKPRSRPLNEAGAEYAKRLGRYCRFEMTELKAEASLEGNPKVLHVALDPAGESLSSEQLARLLESAGQDVAFYIGGAEGFSRKFKKSADRLLSLSQMTLPHELARVMLLEQLYRAFTILGGHPYAK